MNKKWLWGIGVFAYLWFLFVLMPASVWFRFVTLPAQIQMGAVSGTLWSGAVQDVRLGPVALPQVQWQLDVTPLWRGVVSIQLQSGQLKQPQLPFVNVSAEASLGQIALQNSIIRLPVSGIVSHIQLPMPIDAAGELVLNIQQYQQGQPWCQVLAGEAQWQQARLKVPTGWLDLQAIHATMSCEAGAIHLHIQDDNPLGLMAKVELQDTRYQMNGSLKPAQSMPTEVHQAMRFVGQPDAQGRYPLQLGGQLQR